jgi:hypothetical protein
VAMEDMVPVRLEPKPVPKPQSQTQLPPKSVATKLRSVLDDLTFK